MKRSVGAAGFPALLLDRALISRADLQMAEQHAVRELMPLSDAVVALGLISETASYATLAEAGGFDVADLEGVVSSELAIRLVPERIARRYGVVPLQVDNRTLTYATSQPFNPETERDVASRAAAGRKRWSPRARACSTPSTAAIRSCASSTCWPSGSPRARRLSKTRIPMTAHPTPS